MMFLGGCGIWLLVGEVCLCMVIGYCDCSTLTYWVPDDDE
jgi:hypothetical protein